MKLKKTDGIKQHVILTWINGFDALHDWFDRVCQISEDNTIMLFYRSDHAMCAHIMKNQTSQVCKTNQFSKILNGQSGSEKHILNAESCKQAVLQ